MGQQSRLLRALALDKAISQLQTYSSATTYGIINKGCLQYLQLNRLFIQQQRSKTFFSQTQEQFYRTLFKSGTITKYSTIATRNLNSQVQNSLNCGKESLSGELGVSQKRQLGLWLGVCSAWVFSLVVLGGITRLTGAGLSMTHWKFTGERPPWSLEEWQLEFAKYQESPEFQKINKRMNLDEFKYIYWMEWAHRFWGRSLGFIFAVPLAYFVARRMVNLRLAQRLGLIFLMGGSQGFVGWWMVKSGLQDPTEVNGQVRVSPYRLATHLTSAFAIYGLLAWTTMSVINSQPLNTKNLAVLKDTLSLRRFSIPLGLLISITVLSGAFVAGSDAGRAYNDFPYMNGQIFPDEYFMVAGWKNYFENTAAVQFNHRVLAISSLLSAAAIWTIFKNKLVTNTSKQWLNGVLGVAIIQVALGISALMTHVPVALGSLHQANAMVLMTSTLGLIHSTRLSQQSMSQIQTVPPRFGLISKLGVPLTAGAVLAFGINALREQ